MEFSGFQRDTRIIKTSIDRPEIYFQVSCLKESQKSMLDLQHILPDRVTCAEDIPKTIIYMDSIQCICDACDLFRVWMKGLKYPEGASKWVAPFFADMAKNDKRRLCHQFAKVTSECFAPRILIATDSYGLGIDNPDVQLVVQWLVPSSIQKLYQRMGRAMRCGQKQARFLFLHPVWCVGERSKLSKRQVQDLETSSAEDLPIDASERHERHEFDHSDDCTATTAPPKSGARKIPADRRRDMPPGLYDLINPPDDTCIRDLGLKYFDDFTYSAEDVVKPALCCSKCNPAFEVSTRPHPTLIQQGSKDSLRQPWFRSALQAWREKEASRICAECQFGYSPSIVMPDEVLASLAMWGSHISSEEDMMRWVGPWAEGSLYVKEILDILHIGRTMSTDEDTEVFREWCKHNNERRRPRTVLDSQDSNAEREDRRMTWLINQGHQLPKAKVKPSRPATQPTKNARKERAALETVMENSGPLTPRSDKHVPASQDFTPQSGPRTTPPLPTSRPSSSQRTNPQNRQSLIEVSPNARGRLQPLPDSRTGRKRFRPKSFD